MVIPSPPDAPAPRDLEELWLYEGLRIGSTRAMARLLELHHPSMARLAALYRPEDPEPLVAATWSTALGGLSTFVWHTSFRSWLFGILVAAGRAAHPPRPADVPTARLLADPERVDTVAPEGPAQLPWTAWWTPSTWARMQGWLAARPLAEREVVELVDVLGWSPDEARDALGWTDATLAGLHERVHDALAGVLAREMGTDAPTPTGMGGLLAQLPGHDGATAPPALLDDYRRWRKARGLTVSRRIAGQLARRRRHRQLGQGLIGLAT